MTKKVQPKEEDTSTPSLPDLRVLLNALAIGARAVHSLPLSSSSTPNNGNEEETNDPCNDSNDSDDDEDDDEFAYAMAFPEFKSLCLDTRELLTTVLTQTLSVVHNNEPNVLAEWEFQSPELWQEAAEACDVLMEQVEQYIQYKKESRVGGGLQEEEEENENVELERVVRVTREVAWGRAKKGFQDLIQGMVDMEKPQIQHQFADSIQNSRTQPFLPPLHPQLPFCSTHPPFHDNDHDANEILPLLPGHGLETRLLGGYKPNATINLPSNIIAPTHHYPHPYQDTILNLEYTPQQLVVPSCSKSRKSHGTSGTLQNPFLKNCQGVWIDTVDDLQALVQRIERDKCTEVAVDLEAHSYHSFSGFVCLMQLSLRRPSVDGLAQTEEGETVPSTIDTAHDFLVDTLTLRPHLNSCLAPLFANPTIVKVMHGADSDIPWLQRDFGIYVVNLFDTGRAARMLPSCSSAGLAFLLRRYANVEADKKHQLSDWRQRPIPEEMKVYATADTLYLLDIYDELRVELEKESKKRADVSIRKVLDVSKDVCLIRYDKEPFKPDGYKTLIRSKRGKKVASNLTEKQEAVLKALYDWRDEVAREEDESYQAVCGNTGLVRIATRCPQTVTVLQGVMNPMPELVLKYSSQILRIVKQILNEDAKDDGPVGNPTIKEEPMETTATPKQPSKRSNMLSPVMGTEDLYKQAGWMTPKLDADGNTSSSGAENEIETSIEVNAANKNFETKKYMSHSLEMGTSDKMIMSSRGKSVDGSGAARVVLGEGKNDSDENRGSINDEVLNAQKCATRIRESVISGDQNLLGLVKPVATFDAENDSAPKDTHEPMDEDLSEDKSITEIPRSMKEIYRISNRNRRRTKKVQQDYPTNEKDKLELEAAEKLLASSGPDGGDYFDVSGVTKKQRTKSSDGGDTKMTDTREGDISLMTDLGWVKNKKEFEQLTAEESVCPDTQGDASEKRDSNRSSQSNKSESSHKKQTWRESKRGQGSVPFDYSNVGDIGISSNAMGDNPFFAGAALAGGALNQQHQASGKPERNKSSGSNQKRGKRNPNYDNARGGSVRSTVYRR